MLPSTWCGSPHPEQAWAALQTAARSLQEPRATWSAAGLARSSPAPSLGQLQHRLLASAAEAAEEPVQDIVMTDAAVQVQLLPATLGSLGKHPPLRMQS